MIRYVIIKQISENSEIGLIRFTDIKSLINSSLKAMPEIQPAASVFQFNLGKLVAR